MADAGIAPLRLVLGEEELLVTRAVARARSAVLAVDDSAVITETTASEFPPTALGEALGPTLFGGRSLLAIHRCHEASKELATTLLDYAASPEPEAVLVVVHAGGARNKALADGLRAAGAEVDDCAKITKPAQRMAFLRAEVKRQGGRIDEPAAALLLDAVGTELRELAAACQQLVQDTGGTVSAASVNSYYRGKAEASGFTVADAAIAGDVPGALTALEWALSTGVDAVPIADALADGIRTLARVSVSPRGNAYQLATRLSMPPWKIERAQRQVTGWTAEDLADAMMVAARLNGEVKGEAEDRRFALQRAVIAVAAGRGAQRQ